MRHFFYDSLKRFLIAVVATLAFVAPTFAATLPAGYTELEYIESTGTQYIDTGIKANQNTKAELSFKFDQYSEASGTKYGNLFGWRAGQSSKAFLCGTTNGYINQGTNLFCQFDSVSPTIINPVPIDLNQHTVGLSSDGFYVDNVLYRRYPNASAFTTTENITLFAMYSTPTDFIYGKFIAYSFKIWDGNALIRDFVPAKNSSGVIGMYDTVRNEFYTNAGTGTFTAGPTACPGGTLETRHESGLPVGYTKLDYIESTGTQYIDTGYIPNTNLSKIEFKINVQKTNSSVFGVANDTNSRVQFYHYQGNYYARIFSNGSNTSYLSGNLDTVVTGSINFNPNTLTINNVTGPAIDSTSQNYSYSMFLGAMNNIGVSTTPCNSKIYYFKIYENNVLIRDMIPAKNNSNVVGMYDLVSGTFFTNAGTGDFTAGNTVSDPIVEQCVAGTQIKIATTKYTEDAFANLVTTLNSAITKVTNIVDTTVQQATEIGNLATTKQDRPDTDCPAGRKCLLIMGADNKPHWYLIQE